jgi:type I restriction enzyme M protein
MITKSNIRTLLDLLGFFQDGNVYIKRYEDIGATLKVDVASEHIFYKESGITVGRETTSNFSEPENFVVLECVDRLLSKGYRTEHIELEPQWKLGHSSKSGYADIWIRTFGDGRIIGTDEDKDSLLIIECKKADEFQGAWNDTLEDGAQLFSYFQQEKSTNFLCLYTSDIVEGKVVPDYYLLNVQDNKKMLENEEDALSYDKASNNKQLYRVWHETYHCDYARIGLFEETVQPYHIGKDKYTVADLKAVSNETIKKKYSEFSNILRQHNVGAHENAFDKLVNLFLAKVVDETNNPDNLHFYWKGSAYDDDFQLQDRLQRLYRDGMKKFLGEDVTYIEDAEIDKAFRRFKNDPDATRKTIKDYFRALKFFSDNDFSFISVHNKKLFQQNAIILRKVILMLQDIRLKDSDTHQFLGDLFEGFLTKGVKQSEGQFFTPMPIVRFIVTSLPLEQLIKDSQDIPYAIDYACGAGHFLTEYADRIKDFVRMYRPDLSLHDYYSRIMGIEKEYRLSKVSKVSAFMYGHDETQIVYSDALKSHPNIEEGKYSVLIANPPYSVSGFLETLSDQDRKKYKLFNSNINLAKNNAIETFFIERAAQLMKVGGVAGIILPVSVLNKGGIYAKAREIILENFHIVSLVELGSGTFGKTGTNTVVMFLRRKETNTPDADHYANRVECWFNLSESGDEVYQDTELMEKYCEHLGYAVDDYQEFLKGNMTETFIKSEVVQTYHNSFFGTSRNAMKDVCDEAKNIRARYVAKTKTATFRALSADEKKKEADRTFYAFVKAIEREKMYFFMLAVQTENPVLLVKSPLPKKNESNEKIKKFLGYEWINRKGHEGIHYLNVGAASSDEDAEENEADDNTMQEISGINAINTCLFNPNDFNDTEKINYLIRQSFMDGEFDVSVKLEEYVDLYRTVDLIDFSRTAFDKTIKTTPMLAYPKFETSLPTEKLGDIAPFVTEKVSYTKISPKSYISTDNMLQNKAGVVAYSGVPNIGRVTLYRKGDILISNIRPYLKKIYLAKAEGGCSNDVLVFRNTKDYILNDYLYAILSNDLFFEYMMTGKTGLKMPRGDKKMIPNFGIPVPSVEIQKKIIAEYSMVEEQYQKCIDNISRLKDDMDSVLADSYSKSTTDLRLDNEQVFNLSIGRRVLKSELKKDGAYEVFSANVFEPFGRTDSSLLSDFSKPLVLWGIDGDWMVNYLHADRPFHPTDHCGVINVLDENVILPKYLVYPLLKAGEHERFSRANRASTERIKALTIRIPSIDIQKNTVTKVIEIENEINTLKQKMKECKYQKQVILDKYLK